MSLVKVSIFHNLAAGSYLQPQDVDHAYRSQGDPARDYLPGDPMARVFTGYLRVYRGTSGGAWVDAFYLSAGSCRQPGDRVPLDRVAIDWIRRFLEWATWNHPQSALGWQREVARAYREVKLRPLARGDVVAVGEAPSVYTGEASWAELVGPFREIHQEAGGYPDAALRAQARESR